MSINLVVNDATMKLQGQYQNVDPVLGTTTEPIQLTYSPGTYIYGNGAGQVALEYQATLTIANSGNSILILSTGSPLLDIFGNPLTFAKVKEIWIGLPASNLAKSILIGGASSNAWSGANTPFGTNSSTVRVVSGGAPFRQSNPSANGFVVTAGSAEQIKILNEDSVNAATVAVAILGA